MNSILESTLEGRVLRLCLNRPEKRNALNIRMCRELADAIEAASGDPAIGAILLTGNGKSFCAGMDLDELSGAGQAEIDQAQERLFTLGSRISKPLIAAVAGPALGGGMGIVANCHIVIGGPAATFGLPEIRLGLWPFLVYRAVEAALGPRRALELSLTGEIFGPERARELGLAAELAPEPEIRAAELAARIANASPTAIRLGFAYIHESRGMDSAAAGELAQRLRGEVMLSPEFLEKLRAFREKKVASYKILYTIRRPHKMLMCRSFTFPWRAFSIVTTPPKPCLR